VANPEEGECGEEQSDCRRGNPFGRWSRLGAQVAPQQSLILRLGIFSIACRLIVAGLIASFLSTLTSIRELTVTFVMNRLGSTGQHVGWCDVPDGTMQPHIVIGRDEVADDATRIFQ